MAEPTRCGYCGGPEDACFCDKPGFVTYRGYTREQAIASVGKGWRRLIDRLFDAKPDDVKVVQVKEKFGGLRFYISGCLDSYDELVCAAESESYTICERCGAPGTLDKTRSWIQTRCEDCRVSQPEETP